MIRKKKWDECCLVECILTDWPLQVKREVPVCQEMTVKERQTGGENDGRERHKSSTQIGDFSSSCTIGHLSSALGNSNLLAEIGFWGLGK